MAWRDKLPGTMPPAASELLIALDIDGTILGSGVPVTSEVKSAVQDIVAAGAHVAICTGRFVPAAVPIAREVGLEQGHVVCSNGAVTARLDSESHDVLDVVTFDPGPVLRQLDEAMDDLRFAVEGPDQTFRINKAFPSGAMGAGVEVASMEELASGPASRVTVRAPSLENEIFQDAVEQLGLTGVSYSLTHANATWLDITPEGVTKGSGLEALRRRLGLDHTGTIAIGDGGNDIPMLQWAAHGVAMGQAEPRVIAAADATTDPVSEDGVAVVLRSLLA